MTRTLGTPAASSELVRHGLHTVGRLDGRLTTFKSTEVLEARSAAHELLQRARRTAGSKSHQPPRLLVGILTLPALVRSPDLRTYHRAVHYAQESIASGRVVMRYLVSDAEVCCLGSERRKQTSALGIWMHCTKYVRFDVMQLA